MNKKRRKILPRLSNVASAINLFLKSSISIGIHQLCTMDIVKNTLLMKFRRDFLYAKFVNKSSNITEISKSITFQSIVQRNCRRMVYL
jgi:hypothetical protein